MARYVKGYDKDAGRKVVEQFRAATGQSRGAPNFLDFTYDIFKSEDGEYSARYYDPKNRLKNEDFKRPTGEIGPDGKPIVEDALRVAKLDVNGNPLIINGEVQYEYTVGYGQVSPDTARPAPLTVKPTSSTNFKRPYTVAAGWERYPRQGAAGDGALGTLTVLFRDGTLWNYYDVDRSFWIKFRGSISKGEYINRHSPSPELTTKYRNGPADVSQINEETRQLIYTEARASQYRYATKRSYTYTNKATGAKRKVGPGAVPRSAQNRRKKS